MHPEDAVARLPVPARRAAYRMAHRALTVWWLVRRPPSTGVKCVLRRGGDILFVRHTYGDREVWELPGGGLRRGESPAHAAAREALEELGVEVPWHPLGAVEMRDVKVTVLHAFAADAPAAALAVDRGEIAEARWCPAGSPPRPLGPSVRAILKLPGLADAA